MAKSSFCQRRCLSRRCIFLLVCVAGLLAGCSAAPGFNRDLPPSAFLSLEPGQTVGQTFVANYAGLSGMKVYLRTSAGSSGTLVLHLRAEPGSSADLATGQLSLETARPEGYYALAFAPQAGSSRRYYYAVLELQGQGRVELGSAGGDSYLDGALYQNDQPQDAQLSFRLVYAILPAAGDLCLVVLKWSGYLALGLLLFVVPGLALLEAVGLARELAWAETLGVAAGLGVGLYPVLMLWTNKAGWTWGGGTVWSVLLVSGLWLVWRIRPWRWRARRARPRLVDWRHLADFWPDVVWLAVMAMVGVTRLWQAAWLEMPLWHDSVSHLVIVQRMLEAGGLFTSWLPYAPYQTLSTQFGFHTDVAAWAWLSGMGAAQSVIVAGQVLNVLAVMALYPLGYRLFGRWGGCLTALAAGLVSPLPAYYLNWGRYPQLAGQVGLPVAAWWLWIVARHDKARRWEWVIGGLVVAGMVLSYYRMAFYFLAFGVAAGLVILATSPTRLLRRNLWLTCLGAGSLAVVLILPWVGGVVASRAEAVAIPAAVVGFWPRVQVALAGWPAWAIVLWLAGWPVVVVGLILGGPVLKRTRELEAALPLLWLLCLSSLPLLRLTHLPGVAILESFSILISSYIPLALTAAVVVGYGVEKMVEHQRWGRKGAQILAITAVEIGLISLPWQGALVDRDYDLSTRPDQRAAAWIATHVPSDAVFLVNGFAYDLYGTSLAGDAGSWLPFWTRRGITIPAHYVFNEEPIQLGYPQAVNQLVRQLLRVGAASGDGVAAVCQFPTPVTHVYLGQRQGRVFRMLPPVMHVAQPLLPPQALLSNSAFRLIYHQDRVYIFEFDRSRCVQP